MKKLAPFFIILGILFYVGVAFAQSNPYVDTVIQQSTPAGVEHNSFWKEYLYAMTPNPPSGIKYYAVPTLATPAAIAAGYVNSAKPASVANMVSVPDSQTSDIQVRSGTCPAMPSALGCFLINQWYNMSTHTVKTWQLVTIWIKPDVPGVSSWNASSLSTVIAHEFMHGHGLADQYAPNSCNNGVYTLMDAFWNNGGVRTHCDTNSLTQWDIDRWSDYKKTADYSHLYAYIWGDGSVITRWRDNAWTDFYIRGAFQVYNGQYWQNVAQTTGVGWNGSHANVGEASNWEISVWENLSFYGVANQTVRVCAVPIYY